MHEDVSNYFLIVLRLWEPVLPSLAVTMVQPLVPADSPCISLCLIVVASSPVGVVIAEYKDIACVRVFERHVYLPLVGYYECTVVSRINRGFRALAYSIHRGKIDVT